MTIQIRSYYTGIPKWFGREYQKRDSPTSPARKLEGGKGGLEISSKFFMSHVRMGSVEESGEEWKVRENSLFNMEVEQHCYRGYINMHMHAYIYTNSM